MKFLTQFRPTSELKRDEMRTAFLFILPATLGVVIFYILPIFQAFRISFLQFTLLAPDAPFVGLDNYRAILNDRMFFRSMTNTLTYTVMVVLFQTVAALGLALLVKQRVKGLAFFRTAYFLPVVTSLVVVSTVWSLIYNSNGLLNSVLISLGLEPQPFLNSARQALPSIAFMSIWKDVGFPMLIFLGGLQTIPPELYEAAQIDGANRIQSFFRITLPLLKRVMLFVVVVTTIDAFKVFTPVYLMTDGGPANSTMVIVFHIFRTAFRYFNMGYAAAMSFVLLLLVLVVTAVQFRLFRTEVEY
jgi:multiple sugar transport system permease protein